ncbi:hypothetical protein RB195_016343 [Necator americanus]|uniref:Uncharacterized protein n=1 Tax=Necator americanus TaxID=51031 RepID=A0ABR1E8V4_NECAM
MYQDAAKKTFSVPTPEKKFASASAETRSTYDSPCVARTTGDLRQEKRLRRRLCRQLKRNRFEAALGCTHRGGLLNELRSHGVARRFVRVTNVMNRRTTAEARIPAGCTTPFEVEIGVRREAVAGPFLFNFAVDNITRRQPSSVWRLRDLFSEVDMVYRRMTDGKQASCPAF